MLYINDHKGEGEGERVYRPQRQNEGEGGRVYRAQSQSEGEARGFTAHSTVLLLVTDGA
jgi:hypothetical protein